MLFRSATSPAALSCRKWAENVILLADVLFDVTPRRRVAYLPHKARPAFRIFAQGRATKIAPHVRTAARSQMGSAKVLGSLPFSWGRGSLNAIQSATAPPDEPSRASAHFPLRSPDCRVGFPICASSSEPISRRSVRLISSDGYRRPQAQANCYLRSFCSSLSLS